MSEFDPIRDCKHGHQKGKCDSCVLEQTEKINEQQQKQIDELEFTIARLSDACAHLEHHNDQLAATLEQLRDKFTKANTWEDVREVFASTPQQNLNSVKREVYADGYYQGFCDAWFSIYDQEKDHIHYGLEQSKTLAEKLYPSTKE